MGNTLRALAVVLTAWASLTACGDTTGQDSQTQTAPNGDTFNEVDVAFATEMIPHHAQATQMANMTLGREGLSPEIFALAEDIRATQTLQIETMVDWLTAWDRPVPATSQDHVHAHGGDAPEIDADLPGMLSQDELAELESSSGAEFETRWLEMMVEHHRGAIVMATKEADNGAFGAAVALAEEIRAAQQSEIEHLQDLLGS